jgi:hypothetical protein
MEGYDRMVRQPWGCLLALLCGVLGVTLAGVLGWVIHRLTGVSDLAIAVACIALGPVFFVALMDLGHHIEIRLFCRRHGLRVVKVKNYRNHYGVTVIDRGEKKRKRWPKEFEEYLAPAPDESADSGDSDPTDG